MLLVHALVIIFLGIIIAVIALLLGKRPYVADFEASQRNLPKNREGDVAVEDLLDGRSFSDKAREGIAMATDLKYLSDRVGGTGSMEGTLYVGKTPKPKKVRVRTSGGIPICPLCRMPMERVEALKREKPIDFIIWRESEDKRWKCYHKYPVIFVPSQ